MTEPSPISRPANWPPFLRDPVPRDWVEDAADSDNGCYQLTCCTCGETFIAHKRRPNVCKLCYDADNAEAKRRAEWLTAHGAPADWVILTSSEVAAMKADMLRLVWNESELKRLLARVRPHLPSHGTHAEDLINAVEAQIGP